MHWSEQAERLMGAWVDAQKQLWQHWYDGWTPSAATPFSPSIADQWYQRTIEAFETWMAEASPVARDVAGQWLASQDAVVRFWELTVNVWKMIRQTGINGDWKSAVEQYVDQLRDQVLQAPTRLVDTNQDLAELWRLYLEQVQKLSGPWIESFRQAPGHMSNLVIGDGSALIELTNLYWDSYERTFGRLVESPTLGYTREFNEKLLKAFDAWLDFRRASFEYQVVLAGGWVRCVELVVHELVDRAEQGQSVESLQQLVELWMDLCDQAFSELFRSEEYVRTQGQLLNSAMAYRLRGREIREVFLKMYDLPTRKELDQAHRNIYELRKEVKALKKALQELQASPPVQGVQVEEEDPVSKRPAKRTRSTARKAESE